MITCTYTKPNGTELQFKDLAIGQGFKLSPIYANRSEGNDPDIEMYYVKLSEFGATLIIKVNSRTKNIEFGCTHYWLKMYVVLADVDMNILINGSKV